MRQNKSTKHQIPSTKEASSTKFQKFAVGRRIEV
jgi:hypothetical protein